MSKIFSRPSNLLLIPEAHFWVSEMKHNLRLCCTINPYGSGQNICCLVLQLGSPIVLSRCKCTGFIKLLANFCEFLYGLFS